ncbi:MAG: hypothetical protein JXC85_02460 [Candidatus Aenigmarchaeota archaeon]|nr:hypothetical protein [Candidatus Aenigmarchaeota archaeon]
MQEAEASGIITKWIERYYEEKLDRREKRSGPGAYLGMAKKGRHGLLASQLYLN